MSAESFRQLVAADGLDAPLDVLCLSISAALHAGVDVPGTLARIDAIADSVESATIDGVLSALFAVHGFRPNRDDYYDPSNSFLDVVLDSKVGIPISLAVLTIEVARRRGVTIRGVSMPGHFLMSTTTGDDIRFIDPFRPQLSLNADDCKTLHRQLFSGRSAWSDAYLEPVDSLAIAARVLANLKGIYETRRDSVALATVMMLRAALPGLDVHERAERRRALGALN